MSGITQSLPMDVPEGIQRTFLKKLEGILASKHPSLSFEYQPPAKGVFAKLLIKCNKEKKANTITLILQDWSQNGIYGHAANPVPITLNRPRYSDVLVGLVKDKFIDIRTKALTSIAATGFEYELFGVEKAGKKLVEELPLTHDLLRPAVLIPKVTKVKQKPTSDAPKKKDTEAIPVATPPAEKKELSAVEPMGPTNRELRYLLNEVAVRVVRSKHRGLTPPSDVDAPFNIRMSLFSHDEVVTMEKLFREKGVTVKIPEGGKTAGVKSFLLLIDRPIEHYRELFKDVLKLPSPFPSIPFGQMTVTVKRTDALRGSATDAERKDFRNRNKVDAPAVKKPVAKDPPKKAVATKPTAVGTKVAVSKEAVIMLLQGLDPQERLDLFAKSLTAGEIMKVPEIAKQIKPLLEAAKLQGRNELKNELQKLVGNKAR